MAEQRSYTGGFDNRWLFTGKELDESTGLYYFGARFYNPSTSIWLSVDPLAELMPDTGGYTYNFQNPIRYIDPTGMMPEESGGGGVAGPLTSAQAKAAEDYNLRNPLSPISHEEVVTEQPDVSIIWSPVEIVEKKRQNNPTLDTESISIGLTLGGIGLNMFEFSLNKHLANKNNFFLGTVQNSSLANHGIKNVHVYDLETIKALKNVKSIVNGIATITTAGDIIITGYDMWTGKVTIKRGAFRIVRSLIMNRGPLGILIGANLYMIEFLYDEHQNNPNAPSRLIQYEVEKSFNFDLRTIMNGFTPGGGRY